jgi:DNA-binding transcriptional ArsR family regulator
MKKLELRMYGLVNYQLTGIQKGIQFGHAVVKYGQMMKKSDYYDQSKVYDKWANEYQTFIILNGGTTNINQISLGTLNQHLKTLNDNGIICADFYEPDLGDQLTAISFIVDERVFNKKKYPDYKDNYISKIMGRNFDINYQNWKKKIGGDKNVFLRDFLRKFNLA